MKKIVNFRRRYYQNNFGVFLWDTVYIHETDREEWPAGCSIRILYLLMTETQIYGCCPPAAPWTQAKLDRVAECINNESSLMISVICDSAMFFVTSLTLL